MGYSRYDDTVLEDHEMPLLSRDPSRGAYRPMPGEYDNEEEEPEDRIRYGRLPQRVPRRYKTIKRVE
jgi:chitin synthase